MKTELQKQLEQAELEKLRIIDRVKDLKAQIAEANKEPSIFKLMPIDSVWCGWKVNSHAKSFDKNPVELIGLAISFICWPSIESLHKLIAEQRKLDAMKRAADAALDYSKNDNVSSEFYDECKDYKQIVEKEDK